MIQQNFESGEWSLNLTIQEISTGDVFYIQGLEISLQENLISYKNMKDEPPSYLSPASIAFDEIKNEYLSRLINSIFYSKIREHYDICKIQSLSDFDEIFTNEEVRNIVKKKIRDFKLTKLL